MKPSGGSPSEFPNALIKEKGNETPQAFQSLHKYHLTFHKNVKKFTEKYARTA
jgi:hypothetical protein